MEDGGIFDPLATIAYGDRKMAPVTEMSEQQPLTDARRRTRPRSGLQPAATVSGPRFDRNATVEHDARQSGRDG